MQGIGKFGDIMKVQERKYDGLWGLSNEDDVETVSREVVRPCPPPTDVSDGWAVGDLVESFESTKLTLGCANYGKMADGLKLERVLAVLENEKLNKPSVFSFYQKMRSPSKKRKLQARETCLATDNNFGFQESCAVSARTSKRASPFWATHFQSFNEKVDKTRAIDKQSEGQRKISGCPSSFLKKLGSCEMERRTPNNFVNSFCGRSSESNDSDSEACSVGSCSVNSDSPNRLFNCVVAGSSPDADTLSSDAESFSGHGDEEEKCSLPLGEDVTVRIHSLELHAYRCTLGAFYVSGPLNWEQEALLTNLRISLNISNDEHLMELRNLISAGTSIHIC
ncbi:hypothetical protein OIU78_023495 [Salix suchowensis]|nr:hypothetical protein OIU78_023495 [Salix suchowensis]